MKFMDWVQAYLGMQQQGSELPSKLFRLMGVDASDGVTYCLQHYFTGLEALNAYRTGGELAFREDLSGSFGDKLVVFASVLSEV
jgi:hypothetical protein